jgi:transketolase
MEDKFSSFGWNVISIDGHDMQQIVDAIEEAREAKSKPSVIVAHTIKGKGVSFMENNGSFHGKPPTEDEFEKAIAELDEARSKI